MAKNYIQSGNVMTVAAPYAVTSGDAVLVSRLFGIATTTAEANTPVEIALTGVFSLPKDDSVMHFGMAVYWDNVLHHLTLTEKGNYAIGVAVQEASKNDPTVQIRLFGMTV
jgi:predicted RecA/RadA family phage recombinase